MITKKELQILSPLLLGAKFVHDTVEMLGPEYANRRKPPFEGQVLTIVGFMLRYVNEVVVEEPNGTQSLMPLYMVAKALKLKSLPIDIQNAKFREIFFPECALRKRP